MRNKLVLAMVVAAMLGVACTAGGEDTPTPSTGSVGSTSTTPEPVTAWDVVKYMSTDTQNLVYLGNVVRNQPTTIAALESPDLEASPQFQTLLDIYANPGSTYKGTTLVGSEDVSIFQAFLEKWQTGQVTDVHGGLEDTASQIDAVIAQG